MLRFLRELHGVSEEQRRKMIAQLIVDDSKRDEVGDTLFLMLDKLNHMQKPSMLGKVFRPT